MFLLDKCGRDGEASLWSKMNRICSSFCRKKKKSLAWLTEICPAEPRTQTLFHETLIHKTESKPKYSIVLRSMAQLKTGWCLPAASTPFTPSWIGGPSWLDPKCPHVLWVNRFQCVFFYMRKQLPQVFITLPCPLMERMLWALCTGKMSGCSFFSQMKE